MIQKIARFVWMFWGGVLLCAVAYGIAWVIATLVMSIVRSLS